MFFIYGLRNTKIAEDTRKINDNGVIRTAIVVVFQRYFHLFWIPLFPVTRNYIIQIPDTGQTFNNRLFNKIPEPYLSACKEVSQTARTPIWTFAGVILIILIILLTRI